MSFLSSTVALATIRPKTMRTKLAITVLCLAAIHHGVFVEAGRRGTRASPPIGRVRRSVNGKDMGARPPAMMGWAEHYDRQAEAD